MDMVCIALGRPCSSNLNGNKLLYIPTRYHLPPIWSHLTPGLAIFKVFSNDEHAILFRLVPVLAREATKASQLLWGTRDACCKTSVKGGQHTELMFPLLLFILQFFCNATKKRPTWSTSAGSFPRYDVMITHSRYEEKRQELDDTTQIHPNTSRTFPNSPGIRFRPQPV